MADSVVRNDEATGSIPVSSTIFSNTYNQPSAPFCPTLSQNPYEKSCWCSPNIQEKFSSGPKQSGRG